MKSRILMGFLISVLPLVVKGDFNNPGTDYSRVVVDSYVNDSSNRATEFASIFSCVMHRSGSDLPGFANKVWLGRVNEIQCGYGDSDDARAGSIITEAIISSVMAASDSPQEVQGWMTFAAGDRGVFTSTVSADKTTLPPWGALYSAWYRTDRPWLGDESANYPFEVRAVETAFADIRQVDGDVVAVTAYDSKVRSDDNSASIVSKVTVLNGDSSTFRYVVRTEDYDENEVEVQTGQTSADFLYRASIDPSTGAVVSGSGECVSRTNSWRDQWDMMLYTIDDGSLVSFERPGFNFRTSDSRVRGSARQGDFWFNENFEMSPDADSLSVIRNIDDKELSLQWAPGTLQTEVIDTIEPVNGAAFSRWIDGEEETLVWDRDAKKFTYDNSQITEGDHSDNNPLYLWSNLYNASLEWTGGTEFQRRVWRELAADHQWLSGADPVKFYCYGPWSCPHPPQGGDTKVSLDEWRNQGGEDHLRSEKDTANWDEQYTYFLTPLVDSGSFMPATLYFDADGDGALTSDDSPVFLDFHARYLHPDHRGGDWGSEPTLSLGGTYPNLWANLILATDVDGGSCSSNNYWECENRASWSSSGFRWGRGYYVLDDSGMPYTFSDPLFLNLVYDVSRDVNVDAENMKVTLAEGEWNNLTGDRCQISGGCEVDLDISLLDGQTFRIRYDGRRIDWIPGIRDEARKEWFQILNPIDGTEVTDANGTRYVLKTSTYDELLIPELTDAACQANGLIFSSLLEGHGLTDLPDPWDTATYPRPAIVWSDQPELPAGHCVVEDRVTDCR
jgi:hypothetical protein